MDKDIIKNHAQQEKIGFLEITKKHGYKEEDIIRLDAIPIQQAVESAKLSYLANFGNKVNDSRISH